ncbi:hypothetical protein MLD38_036856 [Melastoma candidum]|uniref:Uncharacterized protein n=1 Tax=Melastoma candidum TaxID=119954 RepID=A0ACB9LM63_9MYRT|nr:hypothetical protein MLD38_036856 [Melastoma candidum]
MAAPTITPRSSTSGARTFSMTPGFNKGKFVFNLTPGKGSDRIVFVGVGDGVLHEGEGSAGPPCSPSADCHVSHEQIERVFRCHSDDSLAYLSFCPGLIT